MKDFIGFKTQDILLPTYIRFSITTNVFHKMSEHHPKGGTAMLKGLSASSILLISKAKEEDLYEVFTDNGCYFCKMVKDALLIIGFNQKNLLNQNIAMKYGISFRVSSGVIVQIKLRDPYNYFFDIVNGEKLKDNSYIHRNVIPSLKIIKEELEKANVINSENEEHSEEDYKPEKRLSNLLQISEHYSILASEIEERNANAVGRISYYKIEAIEFDRVDRVAYRFVFDYIDENMFKVGARIELEDNNSNRYSGEVIATQINEECCSMDILFNDHIDINQFSQIGWISLSFSTVNKDVQLDANEKIKNGIAAAKYLDTVLGKKSSAGFEQKDLSELEKSLAKTQYPPNESQRKAISLGICAKDVFLVMGPPGTGKTTVIIEWVKYFVKKEHKRVLVSSQNNKAVDNVLSRIADEKDINMIRIGSESKLQSEVKPYMFENKVKEQRESIIENTTYNMKKIKEISKEWISFLNGLTLLTQLNEEVDQFRYNYQKVIDEQVVPKYNELMNYYKDYQKLRGKIYSLEEKLCERIEKIKEYKNLSSKTNLFLFAPANFIHNKLVKRNVDLLDRLKAEEREVVQKYNSTYRVYTSIYEGTQNEEFSLFYQRERGRAGTLKEIKNTMPQGDNQWQIFSQIQIKEDDWMNNSRLTKVQEEIEKENNRAIQIIEVLNSWKDETASTQNYALAEIVLESVDLVGATCIGINSQRRFSNLDFDITIIDEAGQIQIHNALVPMSVSNKLIMLGDHEQIPPIVDRELLDLCEENGVDTELLEKSLFEKMYSEIPENNKIMLDTQYRMPSEIADTISKWFYEGRYLSADFKKKQNGPIQKLSKKPFIIIDTSQEPNRYETEIPEAGSNNDLEASIIRELIYHISTVTDAKLKEVGIISAYKSQVVLIKEKLKKVLPAELINEMVATLDSFQGQERDIILYSFTKSSTRKPKSRRIGFLNELRRLNVAMTRCKKMLVLIGDMRFLSSCEYMDIDDEEGSSIYEKSEKEFSDFITKMIEDVKGGHGEIINYKEFIKRMGERSE